MVDQNWNAELDEAETAERENALAAIESLIKRFNISSREVSKFLGDPILEHSECYMNAKSKIFDPFFDA